jgi:hypothetical protein
MVYDNGSCRPFAMLSSRLIHATETDLTRFCHQFDILCDRLIIVVLREIGADKDVVEPECGISSKQ